MSAPLVKICGVTREREVDALSERGVALYGLVVGHDDVSYSNSTERARELAARGSAATRGVIVTTERSTDRLIALVQAIGAPWIQLAGFTSAPRVKKLRARFSREALGIIQVVHFDSSGKAAEQRYIGGFVDAGVDLFILDRVGDDGALGSTGHGIDAQALAAFRQTWPDAPTLVAGGVGAHNAAALIGAAGARGVDVFSSTRARDAQGADGGVDLAAVDQLLAAISDTAVRD